MDVDKVENLISDIQEHIEDMEEVNQILSNPLDNSNLIFSTGGFQYFGISQNDKSPLGKILKININTKKYKILSLGHRNVQGLEFNSKNKYIISSEHGPIGGDEININLLDKSEPLSVWFVEYKKTQSSCLACSWSKVRTGWGLFASSRSVRAQPLKEDIAISTNTFLQNFKKFIKFYSSINIYKW